MDKFEDEGCNPFASMMKGQSGNGDHGQVVLSGQAGNMCLSWGNNVLLRIRKLKRDLAEFDMLK